MVEPNNSGAKLASRNLAVTLADLSGHGSPKFDTSEHDFGVLGVPVDRISMG
jgi:hypothetical protein